MRIDDTTKEKLFEFLNEQTDVRVKKDLYPVDRQYFLQTFCSYYVPLPDDPNHMTTLKLWADDVGKVSDQNQEITDLLNVYQILAYKGIVSPSQMMLFKRGEEIYAHMKKYVMQTFFIEEPETKEVVMKNIDDFLGMHRTLQANAEFVARQMAKNAQTI